MCGGAFRAAFKMITVFFCSCGATLSSGGAGIAATLLPVSVTTVASWAGEVDHQPHGDQDHDDVAAAMLCL